MAERFQQLVDGGIVHTHGRGAVHPWYCLSLTHDL